MTDKPKLAVYWAASCGGCEVALLNLNEFFLELEQHFDFIFCPCLLDSKKSSLEALPDGSIDLTLFNGAIRNSENEEMAHLLRRKSRFLAAFGSCACEGCIPALSNLSNRDQHFRTIYLDNPTTENQDGILPKTGTAIASGELTLPLFYDRVRTLPQTVAVDFSIPGCPPESGQIRHVLEAYLRGERPDSGSVVGCGDLTVCDDCDRIKNDKKINTLYRNYEIIPDRQACLLEQGLLCIGIATRNGCGAPCTQAGMPCSGCYGPPPGVLDQGAKMLSALASVIDIGDSGGLSEEQITARVDAVLDAIPDYAGLFYKYGLAGSILGGRVDKP